MLKVYLSVSALCLTVLRSEPSLANSKTITKYYFDEKDMVENLRLKDYLST